MARLLFAAGLYEHSREQFKRLVEVAPEDPSGYAGLSQSLLKLNRDREAREIATAGRALFPDNGPLIVVTAQCLIARGDYAAARRLLAPLCRERSDLAVAALGWTATAALAEGRRTLAVRSARRALNLAREMN